ncbi:PTS glucitol/sorbitol transporter subunit IIA [Agrococcus sp. SGAir0287]|uniref:PTS glucitol/sorbitol transporter subunit IIA n=1 Tax=Agrococcus sp. SGAir0287 TaxID=2070347 RepID=UPI0010CD1DD8|nr:PTS glucitol/sorbitol transporter subunit IIA [Agrococcus sp. SGAir0287]QCR19915.1 PTS sorbitol transporter subunit IIA [Agrococcus sp. SGAir0287]
MSSTMTTLYEATVTRIGADAQDMIDAGVVILFGEPCPDALAEVSVVHEGGTAGEGLAPQPGDVVVLGSTELTVRAAGELAGQNLRELGHVVLYCDPADDQALLPGAVFVDGQAGPIAAGDRIALERRG